MPTITVNLATPIRRTFRVEQVAGMFDVPIGERLSHSLTAEVPGLDEPWTIGAIVGPSGSGKTTLARAAFGDAVYKPRAWPKDRAIIDCFGDLPIKLLTFGLTAVGLGSPPTWLKPYRVLSTGERFRADLLRALLGGGGSVTRRRGGAGNTGGSLGASAPGRDALLVVVDEFTGALDRTVAKTTSAALARLLRLSTPQTEPGAVDLRFVAVTCHHDILPWLAPDWTVELRSAECGVRNEGKSSASTPHSELRTPHLSAKLIRERPPRPSFAFKVDRVPQAMWARFAQHHYLAGGLAASATCYAALWNNEPIAFCAVVAALGWRGMKRIQRLVTLPEFQGMSIGGKLLDIVAACESRRGFRVTITASHPAIVGHCSRSPQWRYFGLKKTGSTPQQMDGRAIRSSTGRAVASFEYVAEGNSECQARRADR